MTFIFREPTLIEILSDPITKAVMNADAVDPVRLAVMLREIQMLRQGGNDGSAQVGQDPTRTRRSHDCLSLCNSIC